MKIQSLLKKLRPDPITLLLLAVVLYIWFRPPAKVTDSSTPLPPFQAATLDGRTLTSDALRGKVVLVNFWATWCPYCRKEMPAMESFYQDYRGKGFEILALSTDDGRETVEQFMADKGYRFPVAMADRGHTRAFGKITQLPTSFIIDKQGRIRHRVDGQLHYGRLEDLVEPLLGE